MPQKPRTLYRVRSTHLALKGEFSRAELLDAIKEGRVLVEDEVSEAPFESWGKVAAHPSFSQAFLATLWPERFENNEKPFRAEETNQSVVSSIHEANTGVGEEGAPGVDLASSAPADSGHTVQASVWDELFDTGLEDEKRKLLKQPGLFDKASENEIPTPLGALSEKPKVKSSKRMKLWGAVVIGLGLLWWMGGETKHSAVEPEAAKETARERIHFASWPKEQVARALIRQAEGLWGLDIPAGYLRAHEAYETAFEADPSSKELPSLLAESSARTQHGDAKKWLEKARALDPQSARLYRAEAWLFLHEGKIEEAALAASHAIEVAPQDPQNAALSSEVDLLKKEYASITGRFKRSDPKNPQLRADFISAKAFFELNQDTQAQEISQGIISANPLHQEAFVLLGDIASKHNQLSSATEFYSKAAKLGKLGTHEATARALFRLGELAELSGDSKRSQRAFTRAAEFSKTLPGLKEKLSQFTNPIDKEDSDTFISDDENFLSLVARYRSENDIRAAAQNALAAYLVNPHNPKATIALGESIQSVATSQEDLIRAIYLFEMALQEDPRSWLALTRIGEIETDQFNFETGAGYLNRAEALASENIEVLLAFTKHYYKRQDYENSLRYLRRANQITSDSSEVFYWAAMLRQVSGGDSSKEAMPLFHQAYLLNPRNYVALKEWLRLKVMFHEKAFAVKFVRALQETEPGNPNLFWALGEIYAANSEHHKAIDYYRKALDIDNKLSAVRLSLGKSLEVVGQIDAAVEEYRLSSLLDKKELLGFYRSANLLFEMGRFRDSEKTLKYLLDMTPQYPGARRLLAQCYHRLGNTTMAVDLMREEVKSNPDNMKYRIELGDLLIRYERYSEAITELNEVVNLPPSTETPQYRTEKLRGYLLLSRAYRLSGKPENAEGVMKLALGEDEKDPDVHKELGFVYRAQQRDKEGVREFEYYLKNRAPAAADSAEIKDLIEHMRIEE